MRRRRPLGRWEDAYLDGIYGLVLTAALVFLLWSLAGCGTYSKHLQQSATTTTNQQDAWQSNEKSSRSESRTEAQNVTRKGSRRTVFRRPDGTVKKEVLELDDTTVSFLGHSGAFEERAKRVDAASEAQRKELKDKLSANSVKTGWPWWVWAAIGLVVAGVLYACYRKFRGLLPWKRSS